MRASQGARGPPGVPGGRVRPADGGGRAEEKVPGKRWPLPALGPRCGPRTTGHGRGQRAEEGLAGGPARSGWGSSRLRGGGWVGELGSGELKAAAVRLLRLRGTGTVVYGHTTLNAPDLV